MLLFNWFVVPFTLGLLFLLATLIVKYTSWIRNLPKEEKAKVKKGVFSIKSFEAIQEVFMESLLHRKIFKVNPLLGYMHASLAFGWFLLIVVGNLESRIFYHGHMSPPYVPIFFKFFNPNPDTFEYAGIFSFLMDSILLVVLSGVVFAWIKRFYSRLMGMKKTTALKLGDKLALTSLWFIFPLRFFAESFTAANAGSGHFLTGSAGVFFQSFLPTTYLAYPAWCAYSLSLGLFFISVPFSRYMHIPTEVLLIFLRKYGVEEKKEFTSFTKIEVNSCSRCGICIDPCQLASSANIKNVQSVYQIQNVRHQKSCTDESLNCLMCGRCDNLCPVGIDINAIRMASRKQEAIQKEHVFDYVSVTNPTKTNVIYFAGCMTHLQPSVKKSMVELMKAANEKFWFMDEGGSICCGRPMMLSGKETQARELMAKNKSVIESSGAKTLVTSCPICYKVFKNEYHLTINVLHHSEYLLQLVEAKKIDLMYQNIQGVYHDPCELGRGSGIYKQPRELLKKTLHLSEVDEEKENAVCCGGSLANLKINNEDRKKVTKDALKTLTVSHPEMLVTGCPMCKKTFGQSAPVPVMDIAEVVSKYLVRQTHLSESDIKTTKTVTKKVEIEG